MVSRQRRGPFILGAQSKPTFNVQANSKILTFEPLKGSRTNVKWENSGMWHVHKIYLYVSIDSRGAC